MKSLLVFGFLFFSLLVQAQWHSLKGPNGGYIYNYKNDGISTYVSTGNGLYRSDDDGKNWIRLDDGLPEFHEAIGFCVDKDEVFLCYIDSKTNQTGFVYSNDKGVHWIQRPLPYPNWLSFEMAYSGGVLLVPGEQELIESRDQGLTWQSSHLGARIRNAEFIRANHSYFFVAGSDKDIYRRAIQDTSWQSVYTSSDYYYGDFHLTDSLIIILKDQAAAIRSVDNGDSWQTIALVGTGKIADFGDIIYAPVQFDIYKSTNRGLSWKILKSFNSDLLFSDVIRAGNSLLGNSSSLGLVRTENEFDTYETSSTGIYSSNAGRLIATDSFLFVLTPISVERYDLINKKWNEKSLLFGNYLSDLFYVHGRLFVISAYTNELFVSENQGLTFKAENLDVLSNGQNGLSIEMFEFKDQLIISQGGACEISTDYGDTWNLIDFKDPSGNLIYTYDIVLYNNQALLVGTDLNVHKTKYYISDDLINWTLLEINFPPNAADYSWVEFLIAGNELFFTLETKQGCNLFKYNSLTHDLTACKGLANICSGPFDKRNRIIANMNSMILNTGDGYYKSDDDGLNWIRVIDDLNANSSNLFVDVTTKDQTIYASCYYFGVLQANWDDLKLAKVKGFVYYDKDNNGKYDSNDEPLIDAFVRLKRSYQYFPTVNNGNFSFYYATAITDTMIPIYHKKHGSFNPKQLPFNPGDTTLEFAYSFPSHVEDATIEMYQLGRARPGFSYHLDIHLKNQGTETCSGDLYLNYDALFNYLSSSLPPDTKTGNTLFWKITDLKTFEERTLRVELSLPASVVVNTNFKHSLNLTNLSINDIDLNDNEVIINDKVVASCDPNEMTVDKEILSKQELDNKQALTYTIRFQNTGNNEAEFVKLSNSLSNFDLNSFQIKASSHPYTYEFDENGRLGVTFDMIHLPDSMSEESKSHGYFCYSIVPLAERIINNTISNNAIIYFDYNNGIFTNNAVTKVQDIVNSNNLNTLTNETIIAVPNPSSGIFQIYSKYLTNSREDVIHIYNLQGKCVFERKDKLIQGYKMNLDGINNGLYFLKISKMDNMVCKLLIQK